jgi:hypothetical protein
MTSRQERQQLLDIVGPGAHVRGDARRWLHADTPYRESSRNVSRMAFDTVISRLILDPGERLPLGADFGDRESPPRPKGASRQVRRQ